MAKAKTTGPTVILEREYNVPLRKGWLKVPNYKRANKATKTLKEFIAKHMKIYDRDLRKVKVDMLVNNEIRFRGMKKPLSKIKVKASKLSDGTVRVYLVDLPTHVKFEKLREEKRSAAIEKKVKEKEVEKKSEDKTEEEKKEEKEQKKEVPKEVKEKEEASKEESMKLAKDQARAQKHVSKDKHVQVKRKALSR